MNMENRVHSRRQFTGTIATAPPRFLAILVVLAALLTVPWKTPTPSVGAPVAAAKKGEPGPHIYWANNHGTTIGRARLDGSHANANFVSDAVGPCGLAISGRYLYWTEEGSATVGRARLDGTGVKHMFIKGASGPCGVAVKAGHIYWDNTQSGTIGRAKLDGTGVNQHFISGLNLPCGVAIDGAHIYWGPLPASGAPTCMAPPCRRPSSPAQTRPAVLRSIVRTSTGQTTAQDSVEPARASGVPPWTVAG